MIKYKIYSLIFVVSVPLLIIAIILVNYYVDPYQQYRETSIYTFSTKKPRYINAGLVKNYSYDSLIIGSSMMANFDVKKVEKKLNFNKALKPLTFGGFISEEVDTIQTALNHRDIDNIFMGLDFYSFSGFNIASEKNTRFPLYLYDDDFYNDFKYLFNLTVLKESLRSLLKVYDKEKVQKQLNTLYDWQNDYNHFFTGKELLNDYKSRIIQNNHLGSFYSFEIMKKNFDIYLLPIIKNNLDINYVFFFPPYSILEYKLMDKEKYLVDIVKFKNYVYEELKIYKNIKLYDFQIASEITFTFKNYKDTTHYHKRINNWILEEIGKNNYRKVNSSKIDNSFMNKIKKFKVQ